MQKLSLGVAVRLTAIFVILACSAAPARASYFDDFYACDNSYFGTLGDCRSNIFYPYDPTESQCRYNSGSSWMDCLNGIQEPMPQLDFCAQARAARDNCNLQYGGGSEEPDWDTYMQCRTASGIDQCE
ncbi:MAG TPA: hypothetical protein VF588_11435 [Pyrinomonadaceae bacterium]|jgi:hypothetical protein